MQKERVIKIRDVMNMQFSERGFVTVVDTFIGIGILDKRNYEKWRFGQVPYLEKVCMGSLNKQRKRYEAEKMAKQVMETPKFKEALKEQELSGNESE